MHRVRGVRLVIVETPTALPTQFALVDHLNEEFSWSVLVVVESLMKDSHNVEDGVKTDEIREGEGAYGVIHPELHNAVNRIRLCNAFLQGKYGLVDHRAKDPVAHETGGVHACKWGLAQPLGKGDDFGGNCLGGFASVDYLNKAHDWDRVHEVHSNHLVWPPCMACDLVDGNARGVAC